MKELPAPFTLKHAALHTEAGLLKHDTKSTEGSMFKQAAAKLRDTLRSSMLVEHLGRDERKGRKEGMTADMSSY